MTKREEQWPKSPQESRRPEGLTAENIQRWLHAFLHTMQMGKIKHVSNSTKVSLTFSKAYVIGKGTRCGLRKQCEGVNQP
jgi:hypothetical protein